MLKQRVITAVVLLAILLPAMFYKTPTPFCAVALIFIAAGAWEWGRLNGYSSPVSALLVFLLLALCGAAWFAGLLEKRLPLLWIFAGGSWLLIGVILLRAGVADWPRIPRVLRVTGGVVMLWMAWLAVAQARVIGVNFLLSILLLVWVADIAAYAAGRAFGGRFIQRKLAAGISPGKSWEGVLGGMVGVMVLAIGWAWLDKFGDEIFSGSLYAQLWAKHGVAVMLVGVIAARKIDRKSVV